MAGGGGEADTDAGEADAGAREQAEPRGDAWSREVGGGDARQGRAYDDRSRARTWPEQGSSAPEQGRAPPEQGRAPPEQGRAPLEQGMATMGRLTLGMEEEKRWDSLPLFYPLKKDTK
jgi:hypothetical protein